MQNYPGILSPEEFNIVKDIYKQIVREPWFAKDIARQHQFGGYVIRAYQSGITEPGKLYDLCARTAQTSFSETEH